MCPELPCSSTKQTYVQKVPFDEPQAVPGFSAGLILDLHDNNVRIKYQTSLQGSVLSHRTIYLQKPLTLPNILRFGLKSSYSWRLSGSLFSACASPALIWPAYPRYRHIVWSLGRRDELSVAHRESCQHPRSWRFKRFVRYRVRSSQLIEDLPSTFSWNYDLIVTHRLWAKEAHIFLSNINFNYAFKRPTSISTLLSSMSPLHLDPISIHQRFDQQTRLVPPPPDDRNHERE